MNNLKDMQIQKSHYESYLTYLYRRQKQIDKLISEHSEAYGSERNNLIQLIEERMKIDYKISEENKQIKDINILIENNMKENNIKDTV